MQIEQKDCSRYDKTVALCAVLLPFAQYYGYGFINGAFMLMCFLYVYSLIVKKSISFTNLLSFVLYGFYFIIARLIRGVDSSDKIAPTFIWQFAAWLFLVANLNKDLFYNYYKKAVIINMAFFAVQEVMYLTVGYRLVGFMSFLPNTLGESFSIAAKAVSGRSSAFFSEPAHFVQYLLPILAIELLKAQDKKSYLFSALMVLTLMLMSSGNALLGLAVISIFFVVRLLKDFKPIYSVMAVTVLVLGGVFCFSRLVNTEYGEKLLSRQQELNSVQTRNSSGFTRIYRGFYLFEVFSKYDKVVGLNSDIRLNKQIKSSTLSSIFSETTDGGAYFNTAQNILIYTGYVGAFIFMCGLISLYKGNTLECKCCVMIFLALGFIGSLFFSNTMFLVLMYPLLTKKECKPKSFKTIQIG